MQLFQHTSANHETRLKLRNPWTHIHQETVFPRIHFHIILTAPFIHIWVHERLQLSQFHNLTTRSLFYYMTNSLVAQREGSQFLCDRRFYIIRLLNHTIHLLHSNLTIWGGSKSPFFPYVKTYYSTREENTYRKSIA